MNTSETHSSVSSPEKIYSTGDLSKYLGVSYNVPIRWIRKGLIHADFEWLPNERIGTFRYYFNEKNFKQILRESGIKI
jgi:hypothetical protein